MFYVVILLGSREGGTYFKSRLIFLEKKDIWEPDPILTGRIDQFVLFIANSH